MTAVVHQPMPSGSVLVGKGKPAGRQLGALVPVKPHEFGTLATGQVGVQVLLWNSSMRLLPSPQTHHQRLPVQGRQGHSGLLNALSCGKGRRLPGDRGPSQGRLNGGLQVVK